MGRRGMAINDVEAAILEFEDEAYHHSLHSEISSEAKAVALAAMKEVRIYRNAAELYGIDAMKMMTLTKIQTRICDDNVKLTDKIHELDMLFKKIPKEINEDEITEKTVMSAMIHYDGDNSKPYCDLVYYALSVVLGYLKIKDKLHECDYFQIEE